MIFDATTLALPITIDTDLCVVGSGAGGAAVAMVAAEAGLKVTVLEAGEFLSPGEMTQQEHEMFPRLYWEGGGRTTRDRFVRIHQGRGVGGSTLHNLNLCYRIPRALRMRWSRERKLAHLPPQAWDDLYDEVENLLSVSQPERSLWSQPNFLLEAACKALGWRGNNLHHNRSGCAGTGFCEIGCSLDAKNNAIKVLIPRALRAGAQVLASCQAVRIEHEGGAVRAVDARAIDPQTRRPIGRVRVRTRRVCLSASATGTPALLRRSAIPDPSRSTGRQLRIHPAVVVAGDFEQPVHAWRGIPQTYECSEFMGFETNDPHRAWIIPAFAHPVGAATLIPGHGASHRLIMDRYAHLAALTAMVHDESSGQVGPQGDFGVAIDYWPNTADRRELAHGLWACAKLLFAAGARSVIVPSSPIRIIDRRDSFDDLKHMEITKGSIDVSAVHPMASVPMSDDPNLGAVDSRGRHHYVRGLWLADGSLFPSSIGVPPQLSIYALGLHVGRALAKAAQP